MRKVLISLLVLSAVSVAATKGFYKVVRLSQTSLGVACITGVKPEQREFGDVIILSCPAGSPINITSTPTN